MKKTRKQFRQDDILDYWLEVLIKAEKGDSKEDLLNRCFACGWESELEKAHIKPLNKNGKDLISNIHLLCSDCHWASENMVGDTYWNWFAKRNQISLIYQLWSYQQ
jgi:5-methylcytosine-specific restriction endonuclease McrA